MRDLVEHTFQTSKEAFACTNYRDHWFFYHDYLNQMNNLETIRWMEQQGYLLHWTLPEVGVNEGIVHGDHAVGNTPEIMSLDCSLFNDLHEGVDRHVIIT